MCLPTLALQSPWHLSTISLQKSFAKRWRLSKLLFLLSCLSGPRSAQLPAYTWSTAAPGAENTRPFLYVDNLYALDETFINFLIVLPRRLWIHEQWAAPWDRPVRYFALWQFSHLGASHQLWFHNRSISHRQHWAKRCESAKFYASRVCLISW